MFNLAQFSARLRSERKASGKNQAAFGELGGVGLQTQSRYEKAETEPQVGYLANLASAGVDVMYVLSGERTIGDSVSPAAARLLDRFGQLSTELQDVVIEHVEGLARVSMPGGAVERRLALHAQQNEFRGEVD